MDDQGEGGGELAPPSACSSVTRLPSTFSSNVTGGSIPGTEHDASITSRNRWHPSGHGRQAIAP